MGLTWTAALGSVAIGIVGLCIWRAMADARTPQGAVAWVIFLLSAPWFAVPAFAVFGNYRSRSYARSRRKSRALTSKLVEMATRHPPSDEARERMTVFERLVRLPVVGGNAGALLIDGEATFDAIFDAIDRAERYVCVQYYTVADDRTGRQLADRLLAAAARGVRVRMIYDGVGSYSLPRSYRTRLSEGGVDVVDPQAARGPTSRFSLNFRNHRKTVIVDGRVGFLGGLNVSDTYVGHHPRFGHWRDTHLRIGGPIVSQLQLVFVEDWHWGTDELLIDALDWCPGIHPADMSAMIVPTGPDEGIEAGSQFFFSMAAAARRRLWIASPYFVPDASILAALTNAALRNVDVRLILTGKVDHLLPWLAAHAYFDEVRSAGVEIYRYTDGFMHQKVLLVDDDLAAVGTANCDNRSFRLNFETMAVFRDTDFASSVATMLEADLAASERHVTPLFEQPFALRAGAAVTRLVAPML